MKKIGIMLACVVIFVGMMVLPGMTKGGFDKWGYNYQARIFNGLFGNADENRPGDLNPDTYLGASTDSYGYFDSDGNPHEVLVNVAGTHLIMKWSKAWHMAVFGPNNIRYDGDEDPMNEDAWLTNHVNGTGTIYDTEGNEIYSGRITILSKIKWVGDTTGYTNPIWGEMAVVQKVINGQGVVFLEIPPGWGTP